MKLHILFCLLLTLLLACNDEGTAPPQAPPADLFRIHLQGGFSNTPVLVSIDRKQIFQDVVTTLPSISLATVVPVEVTQGTHRLAVTAAGVHSGDSTFTILDTLFVGVNYNATAGTIHYRFQRKPFVYR